MAPLNFISTDVGALTSQFRKCQIYTSILWSSIALWKQCSGWLFFTCFFVIHLFCTSFCSIQNWLMLARVWPSWLKLVVVWLHWQKHLAAQHKQVHSRKYKGDLMLALASNPICKTYRWLMVINNVKRIREKKEIATIQKVNLWKKTLRKITVFE